MADRGLLTQACSGEAALPNLESGQTILSADDVADGSTVRPHRHRKLWELAEEYHCPVIGTCLSHSELEAIARKVGLSQPGRDPFHLHLDAVSAAANRGPGSEAMHKRLNQKYARSLLRFHQAKTDHQVRALWKEHLGRGEIAGPLWATLTHRAASTATCQEAYGDVHMLSHRVGAGEAAENRQTSELVTRLEAEKERAAKESLRQRHEQERQALRIRHLESTLSAAQQRLAETETLRKRLDTLENGIAMVSMGRRLMALAEEVGRLREAARRIVEREERLHLLERENAELRRQRDELLAQRNALESLWPAERAAEPNSASARPADCAGCSGKLTGHCVLCVGGRTPLLPQYRELARRLGIRLIHHDGGREEALSRLPDLLAASDAVICPTDCVGHMAYHQLKRHCKQAGKPCVLVRNSGLASFAAGLTRLAEGRADIHPQEAPTQ
jgi:hypothetical protein